MSELDYIEMCEWEKQDPPNNFLDTLYGNAV